MTNTKILQAILDGQTKIREDIRDVKEEIKNVEKRLTDRLDRQGRQLAIVDDDAPSMEDLHQIETRLRNLEIKVRHLEVINDK